MGGQPSRPRRLTIDNEDPNNVIKVSDDVVERIKGSVSEGPKVRHSQTPESKVGGTPEGGTPFHFCQPSLTTIQLQQQHEVDIKKNDAYWQDRIHNLEVNHRKMHEVMDTEFKRAVDEAEVQKQNKKLKIVPPCFVSRTKVLACYKLHPTEPMRCAKEVQEFTECVDMKRATYEPEE